MTKKIIITVFITIIASLGIITSIAYVPFYQIKSDLIYSKYRLAKNQSDFINIDTANINTSQRYEYVGLESNWKNLLNPVFTIIFNEVNNEQGLFHEASVVELERDSIFSTTYKVKQTRNNFIKKYTFDEIKELVKKQDISKNNPDPKNITNFPPLTPEEIENNKKLREREEKIKQEQERALQEYNQKTPQEKIKDLEELKQRQLDNKEEIIKKVPEEMFYADIQIWDKEIEKIKKENGIN